MHEDTKYKTLTFIIYLRIENDGTGTVNDDEMMRERERERGGGGERGRRHQAREARGVGGCPLASRFRAGAGALGAPRAAAGFVRGCRGRQRYMAYFLLLLLAPIAAAVPWAGEGRGETPADEPAAAATANAAGSFAFFFFFFFATGFAVAALLFTSSR